MVAVTNQEEVSHLVSVHRGVSTDPVGELDSVEDDIGSGVEQVVLCRREGHGEAVDAVPYGIVGTEYE